MATMMMHPTLSRRISYRVLLTTTSGRLGRVDCTKLQLPVSPDKREN